MWIYLQPVIRLLIQPTHVCGTHVQYVDISTTCNKVSNTTSTCMWIFLQPAIRLAIQSAYVCMWISLQPAIRLAIQPAHVCEYFYKLQ